MAKISIQKTIVTPDANGQIVQLEIGDAPPQPEGAATLGSIRMLLTVKLPRYEAPVLLAQFQRETLEAAREAVNTLMQEATQEIRQNQNIDLRPIPLNRP